MSILRSVVGWTAVAAMTGAYMSPVRAQPPPDRERRVDALFTGFAGAVPGCAVGVYGAGEILFSKGYGLADLEAKAPITPRTVFDVASLSKQFTAFAVALLATEGRLSLDDEVQEYVPELPRVGHPITVRHLIHHISGLREYSALLELGGWRIDDPLSKSEVLALLKRQRGLNFTPGERYEYNSSNYLLMALIVERISGQSFQQFAEQRIFRPLGMASTRVRYPTEAVPTRAVNYTGKANGTFAPNRAWDRAYGAGVVNVHTSIEDLAKWDRNFFYPSVGDAALIKTLYSPTALNSGKPTAYGYGLDIGTHRGMRAISHGGMGGGSFHLLRLPEQGLSVATLCNRYSLGAGAPDTWTLAREVADIFLASGSAVGAPGAGSSPPPEVSVGRDELAKYVGRYWQASGAPLIIKLEKDQLVAVDGGSTYSLIPIESGKFRSPDGIETYTFSGPDGRTLTYHEIPTNSTTVSERRPQWSPSRVQLQRAVGRFCSSEVPVCWSLQLVGDRLILQRPNFPNALLAPVYPGTFFHLDKDDLGTRSMRIVLHDAGRAPLRSFSVVRGRVSGVLFQRMAVGEAIR